MRAPQEAALLERAIERALENGARTRDLVSGQGEPSLTTTAMTDAVIAELDHAQQRNRKEAVMREPYVFPLSESPFSTDVPPLERRRRVLAVGADVVTDELGLVVDFMSEADTDAVLNDPRMASVAIPTLHLSEVTDGPLFELWELLMFAKNGDEHRRIRNVVAREFTAKAIEAQRPAIEAIASAQCDRLGGVGDDRALLDVRGAVRGDVSRAISWGSPNAMPTAQASWAFDLVRAFFPFMSADRRERAQRAATEFTGYLDDLLDDKRRHPSDDIASRLVADDASHGLTYPETRALAANLVFGGLEATAKAITTGVYHLLEHDKFGELGRHPELIPSAVLELLRFSPPAQSVARLAPVDLVCQDVALRGGQVASAEPRRRVPRPEAPPRSRHARPDRVGRRSSSRSVPVPTTAWARTWRRSGSPSPSRRSSSGSRTSSSTATV